MRDYKVILIGRSGSGKTTAINSVSDIPTISTEVAISGVHYGGKVGTTVAFDYGEVMIPGGDVRMRLYGAPGQSRFSFMWDILHCNSTGILLLVDNHRPGALEETREYLRAFKSKLQKQGTVVLLGIVKNDLSSLPDIGQYQQLLYEEGLAFPAAVVDARRKDSVLLLLKVLYCQLKRVRNEGVLNK